MTNDPDFSVLLKTCSASRPRGVTAKKVLRLRRHISFGPVCQRNNEGYVGICTVLDFESRKEKYEVFELQARDSKYLIRNSINPQITNPNSLQLQLPLRFMVQ